MPFVGMSPNVRRARKIPVEIPVIHDGSGESAAEKSATEPKKPRMPNQGRPTSSGTQESRQPLQKHDQRKSNLRTSPVEQVPTNEMDASDEDEDGNFPFYSGMPQNIFGAGFPFAQQRASRSRPRASGMRPNGTLPQRSNAAEFTNIPAEKQSPQHTSSARKSATSESTESCKSQTVPVVAEQADDDLLNIAEPQQPQETKQIPSSMEQLDSIKSEMDAVGDRVEKFSGEKTDKEYIYLDETMTTLLLKLDMVESGGVEEIRDRRRQLVRLIQEYVRKLEQKVGIFPSDEETLSTVSMESTEVVDGEDSDGEFADALDVQDEGHTSEVTSFQHQNQSSSESQIVSDQR